MPTLTPVDGDPFATPAPAQGQGAAPPPQQGGPQLTPVEGDPYANAPWYLGSQGAQDLNQWGAAEQGSSSMMGGWGPQVRALERHLLMPGAGSYSDELAKVKQLQSQYQAAHPYQSALASGVGGAVSAIPATMAAAPLAGGTLAALGAGALQGGSQGAAESEGSFGDRASQAVTGAAEGTLAAGAGVLGAKALSPVLSWGGNKVANALFNRAYGGDVTSTAADNLIEGLTRQGMTPAQAEAEIARLGPGAALGDTGRTMQTLTGRLATRTDASPEIVQNLTQRASAFDQRLANVVDANAGPNVNAEKYLSALQAQTRANGQAAYGPILNSNRTADLSGARDLMAQFRLPNVAAGADEGSTGAALNKALGYLGNDVQNVPLQVAHNAQDEIDDMASAALRAGKNNQARQLWSTRQAILDAMPPDYNAARVQYASDKAIENALENGRNIFARSIDGKVYDPDLLDARMANASPAEQDIFNVGVRKALQDDMKGGARSDVQGLASRLANDNGYSADKLRYAIGDQPAQNIIDEVQNIAQLKQTTNLAMEGSKTAEMQAASDLLPQAKEYGGGSHMMGMGAGALAGSELGEAAGHLIGHPELGRGLGAVAGTGYGLTVAPWLTRSSKAAADAAQQSMAAALTRPTGQNALMQALAARPGYAALGTGITKGAGEVAQALAGQTLIGGRPEGGYYNWLTSR